MANSAAKKQAQQNTIALKSLHISACIVNLFVIFGYMYLQRPYSLKPIIFFSIPALFLQLQLERMGRPKYDDKGTLIRGGDDLSQPGMTEWFHDVIYLTWGCDVLAVLLNTNKVWYLILAVPGYAAFKIYTNFIKPRTQRGGNNDENSTAEPAKSKRQEKMAKRGNVKYTRS